MGTDYALLTTLQHPHHARGARVVLLLARPVAAAALSGARVFSVGAPNSIRFSRSMEVYSAAVERILFRFKGKVCFVCGNRELVRSARYRQSDPRCLCQFDVLLLIALLRQFVPRLHCGGTARDKSLCNIKVDDFLTRQLSNEKVAKFLRCTFCALKAERDQRRNV